MMYTDSFDVVSNVGSNVWNLQFIGKFLNFELDKKIKLEMYINFWKIYIELQAT